MLQRLAIEELHRDERLPVFFSNVVDGANIGMIQRRGGLGFAAEATERRRIFGEIVRQEFQSDVATEACVLGFVNHTHAAAADSFYNAVV